MLFGNAVLDATETKKRGRELSGSVIKELVEGYSSGEVPDYQMSALLMAIFIQGTGPGNARAHGGDGRFQ